MQKKKQLSKIAILLLVLILSLAISGCNPLSYFNFKKKDVDLTKKYKSEIEENYNKAVQAVIKFDLLVKKLNKHYYTTEDFTDPNEFAAIAGSLTTEIPSAQASLVKAKAATQKFSKTATGQKYNSYINAKSSSIDNLNLALSEDKKTLSVLTPALSDFRNLFTYIDGIKSAQSSNVTASSVGISRQNELASNKTYYNTLVEKEAMANAQASATLTSETTTETTTTTTTTATTSETSESTEEIPDWVFDILGNDYQSKFYVDMLSAQEKKVDSLYTDVFQIDKKVNFKTTAAMLKAIEKINEDITNLNESTKSLADNIIDQSRENKLLTKYEKRKNGLEYAILKLKNNINNPPASSSSNSTEMAGFEKTLDKAEALLDKSNDKIKEIDENLDTLKAAEKGRLTDDLLDDWWRYGGSLLYLIELNEDVNRDMMKDIRKWKTEKINAYIKNHNYYSKLSKYESTRAELEFDEINDKLALL